VTAIHADDVARVLYEAELVHENGLRGRIVGLDPRPFMGGVLCTFGESSCAGVFWWAIRPARGATWHVERAKLCSPPAV